MERCTAQFVLALALAAFGMLVTEALPLSPQMEVMEKACALVFNIAATPKSADTSANIAMPPLETLIGVDRNAGADADKVDVMDTDDMALSIRRNICNLMFALQPNVQIAAPSTTATPTTIKTTRAPKPTKPTKAPPKPAPTKPPAPPPTKPPPPQWIQPVLEDQIAVWPDEQDFSDLIGQGDVAIGGPIADNPQVPLYEDQIVVYPTVDVVDNNVPQKPKPVVTTPRPPEEQAEVLEQYQITHPNGTSEYKLVLSNGLVHYRRMYSKLHDGKQVPVQEGYDSVPIAGRENEFHTQYFVADEGGYRVYKIEHGTRHTLLPAFFNYLDQMALERSERSAGGAGGVSKIKN